ncbi:exopolysaccharide biosynthesis polyprenyl glycosylphosphotransferase [Halobacillus halophilus]|uniref:exopolysaccharide biosynthesis polyprenyl glycosylphosphotransferase n=1 Tax=Halobacillus halophilus TaxID=1570 RepID=UPI00136DD1B8|nr:exopolysaccharide biosynthesis polyprenyl glycosylphosphotransferase [Halobacillus halophilus]MYL30869.1 exopolysaccharide biosynthesis polyprenyl glycosylphosphotransferase [Halobacillus halophilus]
MDFMTPYGWFVTAVCFSAALVIFGLVLYIKSTVFPVSRSLRILPLKPIGWMTGAVVLFLLNISVLTEAPSLSNVQRVLLTLVLQTGVLLLILPVFGPAGKTRKHTRVLFIGEDPFSAGHFFHENTRDELFSFVEDADEAFFSRQKDAFDRVVIDHTIPSNKKVELTNFALKYDKDIFIIPELYDLGVHQAKTGYAGDFMVFTIKPFHMTTLQKILKRGMDLLLSASLLLITSPVLAVLTIVIPLTSKGPAFYKQERLGMNERPFSIYKFRSMVVDAEKHSGPVLARDKDPRITPVGAALRAARLDELPQLFNVLKGDMSLIGPRPERDYFVKQFKKENEEYRYRFKVKPGITGLAQVYGKYTTSPLNKLRFDLTYVRKYSIFLDVKVLLLTIKVIFQRDQARGVEGTDAKMKRIDKKQAIH